MEICQRPADRHNYGSPVVDSGWETEESGDFLTCLDLGFGSEARINNAPMGGVKKKEQKKYPQKPNFLFTPTKAIRRQRAMYNRVIVIRHSFTLKFTAPETNPPPCRNPDARTDP